ncbi:MAG TPA: cysteine desulfurase [Planctomycetes bacterium]|nr:cysteine desulfurase [Planctomycetota bacterium]
MKTGPINCPMERIYLDNNATTPIDPLVSEAMLETRQQYFGNPSSQHYWGQQARSRIERSTENALAALGGKTGGMSDDRLVWTSGGTESNNLALRGLLPPGGRLIYSAVEHPSVTAMAEQLARDGHEVSLIEVSSVGVLSLDALVQKLEQRTPGDGQRVDLVSVMTGNNETGVIQPIEEIAKICHSAGARLHTDAVQAIGKIEIDFGSMNVDAMTIAPHKFHGPRGIGALMLKHGLDATPLLHGGFQQFGSRPGTECPALVVGAETALHLAVEDLPQSTKHLRRLRDNLEQLVRAKIPDVVVVSETADRLPQTSCLAFPGIDRQALLMALDQRGIACSTGSACASGSSDPSSTLQAMCLPDDLVNAAIRFSVGKQTTEEEVRNAADWITAVVNTLRS